MQIGYRRFGRAALIGAVALVAGALLSTGLRPAPVQGADDAQALHDLSGVFSRVAEHAYPAVVSIMVEKEVAVQPGPMPFGPGMGPEEFFERFFGFGPPQRRAPGRQGQGRQQQQQRRPMVQGQGSGFIVSPDGYIITNHHVVAEADDGRIKVALADRRQFDAEVVGSDPQTEIALLKIDAAGLPTLPLGDSDALRVGEWVLAIGSPFGLTHTVTAGIVSAKGRGNVGIGDQGFYADFIQTDAAINPGNSGGPLINLKGEVVGLNTAIFTRSGGYMGIGFAIPINMVRYIEAQLREKGGITRGFLGIGIQDLTPDLAEAFGLAEGKGVLVTTVNDGSPAQKAGLQRDDVIVEFDGRPVEETGSFRSRVASTLPGTKVDCVVVRNGERTTLTVEVGALDAEAQMAGVTGAPGKATDLGLTVQELTDDIAEQLGYENEAGVVVSGVEPDSAAAMAGIRNGALIQEVNRKPVSTIKEFEEAVAQSDAGRPVLLLILQDQYSRYVALRPAR